jgi:radical SAM enzyme (TIGR01210 family)
VSAGGASGDDRRVRDLRSSRVAVDPWAAPEFLLEQERSLDGHLSDALTIFLIGRECPFTCVFCDLWRNTTEAVTPVGALSGQIRAALAQVGEAAERAEIVKLYNASNFFDPGSVPDEDIAAIVSSVAGFGRVTVESHPRLIGERCQRLSEALAGELEVAMGLESVHPEVLPRLNKQMQLEDFERAAEQLAAWNIAVRAFVLVGVPFLDSGQQVEWAVRSVEYAASRGAGAVSLIPVRGGNGEMERLAAAGLWQAPALEQLEEALEAAMTIRDVVVTADTWDLERFAECALCRAHRLARLAEINLSGAIPSRSACADCGWS